MYIYMCVIFDLACSFYQPLCYYDIFIIGGGGWWWVVVAGDGCWWWLEVVGGIVHSRLPVPLTGHR